MNCLFTLRVGRSKSLQLCTVIDSKPVRRCAGKKSRPRRARLPCTHRAPTVHDHEWSGWSWRPRHARAAATCKREMCVFTEVGRVAACSKGLVISRNPCRNTLLEFFFTLSNNFETTQTKPVLARRRACPCARSPWPQPWPARARTRAACLAHAPPRMPPR